MNYEEAPYAKLSTAGLSADYVLRETKRAIAGVNSEIATNRIKGPAGTSVQLRAPQALQTGCSTRPAL